MSESNTYIYHLSRSLRPFFVCIVFFRRLLRPRTNASDEGKRISAEKLIERLCVEALK